MVAPRFDVTSLVAARRLTRPPTWLFLAGLVTGWVVVAVVVVLVLRADAGTLVAVLVGVVGYFVVPVPIVTVLRLGWLRSHGDRQQQFEAALAGAVGQLQQWVDERLGGAAELPAALAPTWLLSPTPQGTSELLPLPPDLGWRVGGAAVGARHAVGPDGRVLLRLVVLPSAAIVADGPEPPLPAEGV